MKKILSKTRLKKIELNKILYSICLLIFLLLLFLIFLFPGLLPILSSIYEEIAFRISVLISSMFLHSYWLFSLMLIFIFSILLFKAIKTYKINSGSLYKMICICILIGFLLIPLFIMGQKLQDLKNLGMNLVVKIETFKKENGRLPNSLSEIQNGLSNEEYNKTKQFFKYELGENPERTEEYYLLSFRPDWIKNYKFVYLDHENKFVAVD